MINIVLLGPPGCGKGTQAARIVQNHGLLHISTGDLIRNEINAGTAMGELFNKFISSGMLVPDQIILKELYRFALNNSDAKGFIFDGFPRTLYQAQMLDRIFVKRKMKIEIVISIDVPENELMKRVLERGKTSGRNDDNEMIMNNRLMVYFSQTQPVIDYYRKTKRLISIDGNQHIDTVAAIIDKTIRDHM